LLTQFNGNRCRTPQFAILKQLVANHKNTPKLKLYNILDGCIVAGFIEEKKRKAFFTLTYNTLVKAYEFAFLDSKKPSALGLYYGNKTANGFELRSRTDRSKKFSKALVKVGNSISFIELKYEGKKIRFNFKE
jgi:hypothetical protein